MSLGWDGLGWDWDLCAGIFYEHRFAMLKIYYKKKSNIRKTYSKKIMKIKNYTNKTIKEGDIAP